ncbi:MAG: TlpA family protein disulfide reductase [Synergistaceae bacterium]|nr:TlpA family protein disulfide reductase [Synergistaceae bacterium]
MEKEWSVITHFVLNTGLGGAPDGGKFQRSPLKKFVLPLLAIVVLFALSAGAANASQAPDMPGEFPKFSSRGLNDDIVTHAIFADKKLTVLNIWTTWCPPCLEEMPDLGRLGRSMPEGSQLAGIILDAEDSETADQAKNILAKAQADFLQILPVEDMSPVLGKVLAIPTTIFVNSQGKIIGTPLVGSRSEEDYRAEIEKILKSMP